MTPSIDHTLHQFANLFPNWTLLPNLTLLPNFGDFHRTLQRVRLANRGRLLLRTPSHVPFGTCICSNVETILSWICHVYGPFEFRTSFGTSILLDMQLRLSSFQVMLPNSVHRQNDEFQSKMASLAKLNQIQKMMCICQNFATGQFWVTTKMYLIWCNIVKKLSRICI